MLVIDVGNGYNGETGTKKDGGCRPALFQSFVHISGGLVFNVIGVVAVTLL